MADTAVETWKKRIDAAKKVHEDWVKSKRVTDCLNYYEGEQLSQPFDEFGNRRIQINKIHPEVRNNIPSLYYYRPFARITPCPEQIDDPGTEIEADTQLLQDTANYLIRDPEGMFRESTFLALKEAHWAIGCVEVGYSSEFVDAPSAARPPLKEQKDTKISKVEQEPPVPEMNTAVPEMGAIPEMAAPMPLGGPDQMAMNEELASLKSQLKQEKFYVKQIPYTQLLVSVSDKPIVICNDWIGYWEDIPLEDVKACKAYKNTADLKSCTDDHDTHKDSHWAKETGSPDPIRLYKIWDLRTRMRLVLAAGHDKVLLEKKYKRFPLKFLRFDIDPYHFYPRPLLLSKLGVQDEYNKSREFLSDVRDAIVPRYTYDEEALDVKQVRKFENGTIGTFIPRKGGTVDPITPVQQPSYSENALQTLTISDKEFQDVGGVGQDAKVANTKTATQAKIAEAKTQVQDSFDRTVVADWLASIIKELVSLAIDNMSLDRWVAINVVPQSQFSMDIAADVQQRFARINADLLTDATNGINWDVQIDLESLSPVSEEEKFQKLMQGLTLFGNPVYARLFSVSPELLQLVLTSMGIKSAHTQNLILTAMQQVVMMEQQLAAQSQNAAPGVPSQPGATSPAGPKPTGPQGPGSAPPKPPQGAPPPRP